MAVVAANSERVLVETKDATLRDPLTDLAPLYLGPFHLFLKSDIIEVLKSANVRAPLFKGKPGISNEIKSGRDELHVDPYNLRGIARLGFSYASECKWESAMNVLLRGWKRAAEFKDRQLRFHFLMKLAEACHRMEKFRQAHAVLKDIEEPDGTIGGDDAVLSYLVLSVRILSANGDVQHALKSFGKAIEGREFNAAVRIWAFCLSGLQKCGAYEAARVSMEALAGDDGCLNGELRDLDHYASMIRKTQEEANKKTFAQMLQNPNTVFKASVGIGIGAAIVLFCVFLYVLEQRSLDGLKRTWASKGQ
mmetsp:Transcript_54000/g.150181  ORF Transcript_54000/g.150181 Transcript_54000/m.150181 type:complete len:307 (-) Transcript_54000:28-948(-)